MNTMLVCYFDDHNLGLDMFFQKEGATEKWSVEFEL